MYNRNGIEVITGDWIGTCRYYIYLDLIRITLLQRPLIRVLKVGMCSCIVIANNNFGFMYTQRQVTAYFLCSYTLTASIK